MNPTISTCRYKQILYLWLKSTCIFYLIFALVHLSDVLTVHCLSDNGYEFRSQISIHWTFPRQFILPSNYSKTTRYIQINNQDISELLPRISRREKISQYRFQRTFKYVWISINATHMILRDVLRHFIHSLRLWKIRNNHIIILIRIYIWATRLLYMLL